MDKIIIVAQKLVEKKRWRRDTSFSKVIIPPWQDANCRVTPEGVIQRPLGSLNTDTCSLEEINEAYSK